MQQTKHDLDCLVSKLKHRMGLEQSESQHEKIIGVNLQSQNGRYFVSVHYDDNQEITKLFEKHELIQAISDFLECETYIGKSIDEFKANFVCKGSIRY